MKYAVLSDIHGNLPALEAVLRDARSRGADHFLLLGDYCLSNPWPDRCLDTIFSLPDATVIRGNEENYLENLQGKDPARWTDGQMQISYWTYRHVSDANRRTLLALPWQARLTCHGVGLNLVHDSSTFLAGRERACLDPVRAALHRRTGAETAVSFQHYAEAVLARDEAFLQAADALEDGIYLFGHTHCQWQLPSRDGRKLFLNPGSCGLPLDGGAGTTPYALLEIRPDGTWHAESIRIPFDRAAACRAIRASSQFTEAHVWSQVVCRELETGLEHMTFFLQFMDAYARRIGDDRRPYAVDTWENGWRQWLSEWKP